MARAMTRACTPAGVFARAFNGMAFRTDRALRPVEESNVGVMVEPRWAVNISALIAGEEGSLRKR